MILAIDKKEESDDCNKTTGGDSPLPTNDSNGLVVTTAADDKE